MKHYVLPYAELKEIRNFSLNTDIFPSMLPSFVKAAIGRRTFRDHAKPFCLCCWCWNRRPTSCACPGKGRPSSHRLRINQRISRSMSVPICSLDLQLNKYRSALASGYRQTLRGCQSLGALISIRSRRKYLMVIVLWIGKEEHC